MRSPRIAPPVKGEEGSTATIPTVLPRRRYACARRCARVDLPAPGGPVTPTTRARPVRGKSGPRISGAPPFFSTALIARPMARGRPARTPSTTDLDSRFQISGSREWLLSFTASYSGPGIWNLLEPGLWSLAAREETLGDDQLLDFGGALADGAQFDVAVELLDGKVLDEAVAAVDLERAVCHADRHLGGVVLRLGREAPVFVSPVLGLRRALGEEPGRVDPGRHLGQIETDRLELADSAAKLPTLLRIPERRFVRAPRDPHRERRDRDPAGVQDLHRVGESFPLRPEEVLRRDPAVLHHERAGVGRPHAELVLLLAHPDARIIELDDEGGDPAVPLGRLGNGHQDGNAADRCVGDEVLRAVQDPAGAAIAHGCGLGAARVGARLGLGQTPRRQPLSRSEPRHVTAALRLIPEPEDVARAERRVSCQNESHRAIHARELLDDRRIIAGGKTRPSVFLRKVRAEQAEIAELSKHFTRELLPLVPLHDMRPDLRFREFANGLQDGLSLGRYGGAHGDIVGPGDGRG